MHTNKLLSLVSLFAVVVLVLTACNSAVPTNTGPDYPATITAQSAELTRLAATVPVLSDTPDPESTPVPLEVLVTENATGDVLVTESAVPVVTATAMPETSPQKAESCADYSLAYEAEHGYVGIGSAYALTESTFPNCATWMRIIPLEGGAESATGDVFGFVNLDGFWQFSDVQPAIVPYQWESESGNKMIYLEATSDRSTARFRFYDLVGSQLITVDFNGETIRKVAGSVDIHDVVAELEPDNDCNWPNSYVLQSTMFTEQSATGGGSDAAWTMVDGCSFGWIQVYTRNPDSIKLVVATKNGIYELVKSSTYFFWGPEQTDNGYVYFWNGGAIVTINPETGEFSEEQANVDLYYAVHSLSWDDSTVMYLRFPNKEVVGPYEEIPHEENGHQYIGWDEIGENLHVAGFTFGSDGKRYTALYFSTGSDTVPHGPAIIANTRQFVEWTVDGTTITGAYNDGTTVVFQLKEDGSVVIIE